MTRRDAALHWLAIVISFSVLAMPIGRLTVPTIASAVGLVGSNESPARVTRLGHTTRLGIYHVNNTTWLAEEPTS